MRKQMGRAHGAADSSAISRTLLRRRAARSRTECQQRNNDKSDDHRRSDNTPTPGPAELASCAHRSRSSPSLQGAARSTLLAQPPDSSKEDKDLPVAREPSERLVAAVLTA